MNSLVLRRVRYPQCDATGDPARHPKTSKHGGPVPASDVRSPAAAPHAADCSPAAAPAQPPCAECGHHTSGQTMSVVRVTLLMWAVGFVMTLQSIPGFSLSETVTFVIQQQFDSSACRRFPKLSKCLCHSDHRDLLLATILTSSSFFFFFFSLCYTEPRLLYQHPQWRRSWLVEPKTPVPLVLQPQYPSRPCCWETDRPTVTKLRCTFALRWYKTVSISQGVCCTGMTCLTCFCWEHLYPPACTIWFYFMLSVFISFCTVTSFCTVWLTCFIFCMPSISLSINTVAINPCIFRQLGFSLFLTS